MAYGAVRVYLIITFVAVGAVAALGVAASLDHNPQQEYCVYSVDPRDVDITSSGTPCRFERGTYYLQFGSVSAIFLGVLQTPAYLLLLVAYARAKRRRTYFGELNQNFWRPIVATFLVVTGLFASVLPAYGAVELFKFGSTEPLCTDIPNWYSVVRIAGGAEECRLPRGMILENAISLAVAMTIGLQWPAYLYFAARWTGRRTLAGRR